MSRRHLMSAVFATCSALLLAACTTTLQGKAVSVFDDPFSVAGMPATDGPTGLRDDAAGPSRVVLGTDDGEIDELARQAVSDIEEYWEGAYSDTFDGEFTPVEALISWDANGFDGQFCDADTYGLVNAAFCYDDETIGWDRGELLPALRDANGEMGVTMVLAHEYGHAVQRKAGLTKKGTPTLLSEQQADCFAGSYMRWVAEGSSPRFTLSTGEGLNNVLAAVIAFRDPLLSEGDPEAGVDEHGSAFERLSAFQIGFTDGPSACASIDMREIGQRRGDLPVLLPGDQTGELAITEESVRSIVDAMGILFEPAKPPELSFDASQECPDARLEPAGVVLSGNQHHHRRHGRAGSDGRPGGRRGGRRFGQRRQHRVFGAGEPLHAGHPAGAWRRRARQRRGGAAHGLPDRRGHHEDVKGSDHPGRQHHRIDRG